MWASTALLWRSLWTFRRPDPGQIFVFLSMAVLVTARSVLGGFNSGLFLGLAAIILPIMVVFDGRNLARIVAGAPQADVAAVVRLAVNGNKDESLVAVAISGSGVEMTAGEEVGPAICPEISCTPTVHVGRWTKRVRAVEVESYGMLPAWSLPMKDPQLHPSA